VLQGEVATGAAKTADVAIQQEAPSLDGNCYRLTRINGAAYASAAHMIFYAALLLRLLKIAGIPLTEPLSRSLGIKCAVPAVSLAYALTRSLKIG
jgi:hypothetical protein